MRNVFTAQGTGAQEGWVRAALGFTELSHPCFPLAAWETPFDPMNTRPSLFYLSNGRPVTVSMMKIEDLTTPYFRDKELSCTVVELRYSSNHSALFILPDEGRMRTVEAALAPETLRRWRESLQMT